MAEAKAIVVRGVLGWASDSPTASRFECYGPNGRWGARPMSGGYTKGHKLPDALAESGASEGAQLLVVAVDRFAGTELFDAIKRLVEEHGRA